jgi:rRNA N6-adenosine-methyltransferase METTL5
MLTIGSAVLGAGNVLGIDIDFDALTICQSNISNFEDLDNIDLLRNDCVHMLDDLLMNGNSKFIAQFDTVLMNPPFGTKQIGIDMKFLKLATLLTNNVIYSLQKSSTREYIRNFSKSLGFEMTVVYQLKYNIPKVEKNDRNFRKQSAPEIDIQVDFLKFSKILL